LAGTQIAVVLANRVPQDAPPHEADVLIQADAVAAALLTLGHDCRRLDADLDLARLAAELRHLRPAIVFNLVEGLNGSDRLISLVPALLEQIGQRFTGAPADALFVTTNKLLAKACLRAAGILTPAAWRRGDAAPAEPDDARWIVKSCAEQASLGLDDESVVTGVAAAARRIDDCAARFGGDWFAERYVEGRELNVSLLAGACGPEVLPLAEIEFDGYPPGKPRVVGYLAKWEPSSFEYRHTIRRFLDEHAERGLAAGVRALAARCWELFGLRGYARVDLRVDGAGRTWVLEVNANPCLAPDAGFAAALARAGLGFEHAIARIVADAHRPPADGDA
jgi:D-alanine-D-alanine ligase